MHAHPNPALVALVVQPSKLKVAQGAGMTGTLPSSWSEPGAWPHLEQLDLGSNQLTGRLLNTWPQSLQELQLDSNQLTGRLSDSWPQSLQLLQLTGNLLTGWIPTALSSLLQLKVLSLGDNSWTGELPSEWYTANAFPQLFDLRIGSPHLTGTLPSSWGSPAFQNLHLLSLQVPQIHSTLPENWASPGSYPKLQALILDAPLHGTIPHSWASRAAFHSLQLLNFTSTLLQGSLPAFNNANLNSLGLSGSLINSSLSELWSSLAPLSSIQLLDSPISGSLPDLPGVLPQLVFLSLLNTEVEGRIPLSWLEAGGMLSHVSYLSLDNVWEDSVANTDWRQRLCLNQDLYGPDVTGKQVAGLPDFRQFLLDSDDSSPGRRPNLNISDYSSWLQDSTTYTSASLGDKLLMENNQLTSAKAICANHAPEKVLLIAWLTFGGCCLITVGLYACLSRYRHRSTAVNPRLRSLLALVSVPYETLSGLGGLAFYYYDLVTNIIVLAQVWGKWPGHALVAIFFFHFALTGCVVAFHGLGKYVFPKPDALISSHRAFALSALLAFATSPIAIPVVFALDTVAFLRQLVLCSKHLVQLPGLKWLQPGHIAVSRLHHCIYTGDYFGLSWVDLENYESMHNLVAAVFQSLPTAILNSLLFSLGNQPSHGIFLSNKLFVASITASCLAMLKSIIVILWQAHQRDVIAVKHLVDVVAGKKLDRKHLAGSLQTNASVELLVEQYRTSGSAPLGMPNMP